MNQIPGNLLEDLSKYLSQPILTEMYISDLLDSENGLLDGTKLYLSRKLFDRILEGTEVAIFSRHNDEPYNLLSIGGIRVYGYK